MQALRFQYGTRHSMYSLKMLLNSHGNKLIRVQVVLIQYGTLFTIEFTRYFNHVQALRFQHRTRQLMRSLEFTKNFLEI